MRDMIKHGEYVYIAWNKRLNKYRANIVNISETDIAVILLKIDE